MLVKQGMRRSVAVRRIRKPSRSGRLSPVTVLTTADTRPDDHVDHIWMPFVELLGHRIDRQPERVADARGGALGGEQVVAEPGQASNQRHGFVFVAFGDRQQHSRTGSG